MNDIVRREGSTVPVSTAQPTALLEAIAKAAANPEADIEKMERLFAMHEKMVQRESEAAFNAAMARAQAKIEPVANNAYNDQTKSRYAKLAAIAKEITPIITAEGLALSFDTEDCPKGEGWLRIAAIVSHAAGFSRRYHQDIPLDDSGAKGTVNKTKVHATGSSNSYARRYLTCMIFNVSTEDDTDGNDGGQDTGLTESEFVDHFNAIEAAVDDLGVDNAWKAAADACHKKKDPDAHARLKAATIKRKLELKKKATA